MAAFKKDGLPNIKFYESAETISQFEPVKNWITKHCKKVKISNKCICLKICFFVIYKFNKIYFEFYLKKSYFIYYLIDLLELFNFRIIY